MSGVANGARVLGRRTENLCEAPICLAACHFIASATTAILPDTTQTMADEDQNVRMPMDDGGHDAEIRSDDDDERWGENDYIDDIGEEDEEESVDDDDDDSDDSTSDDDVIEDEMAEQFIRTFSIGNYDTEFDDALCVDRSVTFSARPTQASYDKPDNWVERNRIGMERVEAQLQSCIDSVSHVKGFNLDLLHNNYGDQLLDNEEPIVWHEPILDDYWDQLEAAIYRRKQDEKFTDIRGIYILNVEMKKERIASLVAIFRNRRATYSGHYVYFNNANLCGEGILWLSKLVEVSTTLQSFFIGNNRIDNMDSARYLSRSLKSHDCINSLLLPHCDLGSSPDILSVILQSDIKRIDLHCNNIDSLGAAKIAEYLEGDTPIHRIDLEYNRLNDDDVILISQALKRNTNLRHMDLKGNNFTSIGVNALLNSVFDSSSLNALSESNHTLLGMNFFDDNNRPFSEGPNCISRLLQLDRTQKILFVLQDKDSLLQYLANVPVGLMPQVLAFPLRCDDIQLQHKYLNVLYSTMRWWNMPLLYSYCNCCIKSDTKRKRR